MNKKILVYRNCPLCNSKKYKIKFKQNYELKELEENLFSARRARKKKTYEHNTFLICENCGIIYSSPIQNPEILNRLYKKSSFTYGEEEANLKKSYGSCLRRAEKYIKNKSHILDVGTGNGFFLEEALSQGYKKVYGIEPSKNAVESASKKVKNYIINDVFKEAQFKNECFDVITLFQVIDHVTDPNQLLKICQTYLKKDGILICISHDVGAFSAKIMGEKSPIFDIEHTQLFSKKTICQILNQNNFKLMEVFNMTNRYSIKYWLKISPIPNFIKNKLKSILGSINLLEKSISIKAGNFGIIARKR